MSGARSASTRSGSRRRSNAWSPARSSRSIRSPRKRGPCGPRRKTGPRTRSSCGPRTGRTCRSFRRRVRSLKGRGDFVHAMKVALGCRALDDLLGGGVEEGCITLLHGEAGSGKTNFCLQLARNVVRAGHKVIYIDTEGVSLDRLQQICGDDFDVVVKNILFSEPYSFEEQEKLIDKAVKLADGNAEVGLIVIDSITMHYRLTMRDETRRDERYGLTRQIAKLLRASRVRGIPVVVTSQVYTDIDTGLYMPLGGHMLSHNAKTIVRLERTGVSTRAAVLIKYRHLEEGAHAAFRITAHGLED